jgi:hypothetical protein
LAPQYSLEIQARIPAALAAIHNYIREHSDTDDDNPLTWKTNGDTVRVNATHDNSNNPEDDDGGLTFDDDDVDERRDQIAQAMWNSYQKVRAERRSAGTDGLTELDSDEDDSDLDDELDNVL